MEQMNVYTINDKLAKECGPVFESKNHATAWRAFLKMLDRDKLRPEEYQLLHIGSIDHSNALFVVNPCPCVLCEADTVEEA